MQPLMFGVLLFEDLLWSFLEKLTLREHDNASGIVSADVPFPHRSPMRGGFNCESLAVVGMPCQNGKTSAS
jgi:hypothetical protein